MCADMYVTQAPFALTHFTKYRETLLSIIYNGFYFFPNPRGVFENLLGNRLKEPECRGMISFSDYPVDMSHRHRANYGNYGIAVNKDWALSKGASKVLYVGVGTPVFNAFATLYRSLSPKIQASGNPHLDQWLLQLGATRPEFAKSFGANLYPELLTLHDYMQSDEYIAESEWRIVNPMKGGAGSSSDYNEIKELLLKVYKSGLFPALSVSPSNIEYLICPNEDIPSLRDKLPETLREIRIIGVTPA